MRVKIHAHMIAKFGADENQWPSKLELARQLEMRTETLRGWLEERVTRMELETLEKWSKFLDVPPTDILILD
jgi:DNA-binding Xre family transcriptional regulator